MYKKKHYINLPDNLASCCCRLHVMLCRQCASDIIVLSDAWVVILFDLGKGKKEECSGIITRLYSIIRFRCFSVHTVGFYEQASDV